jgi:hypothetical protein
VSIAAMPTAVVATAADNQPTAMSVARFHTAAVCPPDG